MASTLKRKALAPLRASSLLYEFFKGCHLNFGEKAKVYSFILSIYELINIIVYAHGRRLCSNWVRHGSVTISYPQCSLTFMRERYLHRSFAYSKSAVGIDVVSVHKLFAYKIVSTVSTDIVSSHTKYCRIPNGFTR